MGSIYFKMKSIYLKMHAMPILGPLCIHISPFAQSVARKLDSRSNSTDSLKQIEILSQALTSLQRSFKNTIQQECALLQSQIDNYHAQINDYRDRLEFVRLEIMEECNVGLQEKYKDKTKIQPQILNQEKYKAALAANTVVLNVGCGHKPIAGCLNVDRRNLPGVDIVAEADALPFAPGVVAEIYAAHLVEHFRLVTLKNKLFPYWLDMLAPEGILKIIVPDMPSMIAAYNNGEMSFSDLGTVIFGAQDYEDDFHYAMFSPQSLQSLLVASGFKYVKIVAENRSNGKCRESEVWARKL